MQFRTMTKGDYADNTFSLQLPPPQAPPLLPLPITHPPLPPPPLWPRLVLHLLSWARPRGPWLYSVLHLRFSTFRSCQPDSIVPEECIELPLEINRV